MSKQVMFSNDTKSNDGGEKIKKTRSSSPKPVTNPNLTLQSPIKQGWLYGCLKHPGCLWCTPCDCKNCTNFI